MFQFHDGTIKAILRTTGSNRNAVMFQFHDGTIKAQAIEAAQAYLNKFQFHDGTIKAE